MMLHVTTGNCLCVGVKIEHTKGAALLPMSPQPSSARAQREGREFRDEWSLQPLPPKSSLNVRASELFPYFYPLLIFLQTETSQKPQHSYSGELFNPCSRKREFSAMAAPRCVSSASRDLKAFCPFFRAEGEITLASVLRTQLQGPGSQGPQKCQAGYCPIPHVPCIQLLLLVAPVPGPASSHLPPRGPGVRSTWPRKPQPVLTRVQFDLHSPKQDSPWMEKRQPPAGLVLCT